MSLDWARGLQGTIAPESSLGATGGDTAGRPAEPRVSLTGHAWIGDRQHGGKSKRKRFRAQSLPDPG